MGDFQASGQWQIYSIQKTLPYLGTIGSLVGAHNYLALVDPNGNIQVEMHGTYSSSFTIFGSVPQNYLQVEIFPRNKYLGDQSILFSASVMSGSQTQMSAIFYNAFNQVTTALNASHDLYDGFELFGTAYNSNSVWNSALINMGISDTSEFNGPGSTPGASTNLFTTPSNNSYIGTPQDSQWVPMPQLNPGQLDSGNINSPTSSSPIDVSGNFGTLTQNNTNINLESGAVGTIIGDNNTIFGGASVTLTETGNNNTTTLGTDGVCTETGLGEIIFASGAKLILGNSTTATIKGDGDILTVGDNCSVNIAGSDEYLTLGLNSKATVFDPQTDITSMYQKDSDGILNVTEKDENGDILCTDTTSPGANGEKLIDHLNYLDDGRLSHVPVSETTTVEDPYGNIVNTTDIVKSLNADGSVKTESTTRCNYFQGEVRSIDTQTRDGAGNILNSSHARLYESELRGKYWLTMEYGPDNSVVSQTITYNSPDGISSTSETHDGKGKLLCTDDKTTDTNGNKIEDYKQFNPDGTLELEIKTTTSVDGNTINTIYLDGNNTILKTTLDTESVNENRITTEDHQEFNQKGDETFEDFRKLGPDGVIDSETKTFITDNGNSINTVYLDVWGNILESEFKTISIDPSGNTTNDVKQFGSDGTLESETKTTTSPDGDSISTIYLDGSGNVLKTTSDTISTYVNGNRTDDYKEYDPSGALTYEDKKQLNPDGVLESEIRTMLTDDGNSISTTYLDGNGNILRSTLESNGTDAYGNKIQDTKQFSSDGTPDSEIITTTSPDGSSITTTYLDGQGHIQETASGTISIDQYGNTLEDTFRFSSDGWLEYEARSTTSPDGNYTSTTYWDGSGFEIASDDKIVGSDGSVTTNHKEFNAGEMQEDDYITENPDGSSSIISYDYRTHIKDDKETNADGSWKDSITPNWGYNFTSWTASDGTYGSTDLEFGILTNITHQVDGVISTIKYDTHTHATDDKELEPDGSWTESLSAHIWGPTQYDLCRWEDSDGENSVSLTYDDGSTISRMLNLDNSVDINAFYAPLEISGYVKLDPSLNLEIEKYTNAITGLSIYGDGLGEIDFGEIGISDLTLGDIWGGFDWGDGIDWGGEGELGGNGESGSFGLSGTEAAVKTAFGQDINIIARQDLAKGNIVGALVAEIAMCEVEKIATQTSGNAVLENAQWDNRIITWSLADASGGGSSAFSAFMDKSYEDIVKNALAAWSKASGLTFQEVKDSQQSDIRFGWGDFDSSETTIVGYTNFSKKDGIFNPGSIIRLEDPSKDHLTLSTDGQMVYDGTNASVYQTLLHEIGHALGLASNADPSSIMSYNLTNVNRTLDATDVTSIHAIYNPADTMTVNSVNQLVQAIATFVPPASQTQTGPLVNTTTQQPLSLTVNH